MFILEPFTFLLLDDVVVFVVTVSFCVVVLKNLYRIPINLEQSKTRLMATPFVFITNIFKAKYQHISFVVR